MTARWIRCSRNDDVLRSRLSRFERRLFAGRNALLGGAQHHCDRNVGPAHGHEVDDALISEQFSGAVERLVGDFVLWESSVQKS